MNKNILKLPESREVLFEKYNPYIAMEEIFYSKINNCEIVNDVSQFERYSKQMHHRANEYIFYIKDNKVLFYHLIITHSECNNSVFVDFYSMFSHLVSHLVKDYKLNRYEAVYFLRTMLLKYLKIEVGFISTSVYLRTDIIERDLLDRTIYEYGERK